MSKVFTVQELTQAVKNVLESEFPFVWVRGQVGNIARPGSGHIYFTLKDGEASLSVVWFKSNQKIAGNTQTRDLSEGLELVCAGRLAVYPPRGTYQLVAEFVQDQGVGRLHMEFEALKKKLTALGYFDASRKRPLPQNPARVGIITAPSGAAIRDFLRLAKDRGWGAQMRIYPSLVQGEGAVDNVVFALEQANLEAWAEVLVLIRGGGSLEDLWTFNTEQVATAVYSSQIPVVSGIGHEVDMTISDLVADQRAATPSHVPQLLWTERRALIQMVDELEVKLASSWSRYIQSKERPLRELEKALSWMSPLKQLQRRFESTLEKSRQLEQAMKRYIADRENIVLRQQERLQRIFTAQTWQAREQKLDILSKRLFSAQKAYVQQRESRLDLLQSKLSGFDPDFPLKRGYSLVTVEKQGQILRSPEQVSEGDLLNIKAQKGQIRAEVVGDSKANNN
jgi:exodeoxyribonuclease VII large subunit